MIILRSSSRGRPRSRFPGIISTGTKVQNTPLDFRLIAGAQGCLFKSAVLKRNEIHASAILSTPPKAVPA